MFFWVVAASRARAFYGGYVTSKRPLMDVVCWVQATEAAFDKIVPSVLHAHSEQTVDRP